MSDTKTILADLREIALLHEPIDLLSTYQGAPISFKATVKTLTQETALIAFTPQAEALSLTLDKQTTILTRLLAEPVTAAIVAVDLKAGQATLEQFHYAHSKIGDRMVLRVAPAQALEVQLSLGEQYFTGTLADMSLGGLGLHLAPPETALALRVNAVAQLKLTLPPTTQLDLLGTISYVKKEARACRVGITLVQVSNMHVIIQYIQERRSEIMRALQAAYEVARR